MAHRVLTVCGLKGGIGKSAVATNLAAWWSAAGQRVLLIDADPNQLFNVLKVNNTTGLG
jgi:cellulose biosynthesis protein BcsQ